MANPLKIGVVGASGRMGRMVVSIIAASSDCELAGASEAPGSAHLGADAGMLAGVGENGVIVTDDAAAMFAGVDAVIDFTVPAATLTHAQLAADAGCALVAGTTGLEEDQRAALEAAATSVPMVWAPNMSAGVNLLFAVTQQVARALGDDFDIEIVEMHHHHRKSVV